MGRDGDGGEQEPRRTAAVSASSVSPNPRISALLHLPPPLESWTASGLRATRARHRELDVRLCHGRCRYLSGEWKMPLVQGRGLRHRRV